MISVWVEVPPGFLAVNRAYTRTRTGVRKSTRYAVGRARVAEALVLAADGETWTGPVSVRIRAVWAPGGPVGDVDAPIKGVLDAIEDSGLITNDRDVMEVAATKETGETAGIWVSIEKI